MKYVIVFIVLICILYYIAVSIYTNRSDIDVVISHYKEDLSWVDTLIPKHARVFIYSKSDLYPNCKRNFYHYKLDNIGRCDHTYLYHIIHNYYSKSRDHILFLPGSCDLWYKNIQLYLLIYNISNYDFNNILSVPNNTLWQKYDNINNLNKYCSTHNNNKQTNCELIKYKFNSLEEFGKHFNIDITHRTHQGMFSIKKHVIYNRTYEYYNDMLNIMNTGDNILNGHFLERCWYNVFITNK